MAVLNQNVPDDVMKKFNESARAKFGDKKGSKHLALIEAIEDWLKKEKKQRHDL